MRRRHLIAAALGIPASAALPAWAAQAADGPHADHTVTAETTWSDGYDRAREELDTLGLRYVTADGAASRDAITDNSLWLYAQAVALAGAAPAAQRHSARRLAAEAAMFTAGCHVDCGNEEAAADMYGRAHSIAGDTHPDLRAFILAQAQWVDMYSGDWARVLRRSPVVLELADRHGGYGRMMGYAHYARALSIHGMRDKAVAAMDKAIDNAQSMPSAQQRPSALRYTASKTYFSCAMAAAELGLLDKYLAYCDAAVDGSSLGWIDRQLLDLGGHRLVTDPEHAAHRIRFQVQGLPSGTFSYCIRAEADRLLTALKQRNQPGREQAELEEYLSVRGA
jgi:tetratricopeptide (TPR) repeat protein